MFVDARELAADAVVDADVCIVGAGPAGITLAREFDGRRYDVVLLESGGLDLDDGMQPLGQAGEIRRVADTNPLRAKPLRTRRQFGGNANAWSVQTDRGGNNVRLARLSESDFERRDWVENSGWPIGLADLAPHYERAQRVFGIEEGGFDAEDWEYPGASRLHVPGGDLETAVFRFGRGKGFRKAYRRELEQSSNIRVYHHATAIEVETDDDASRVTGVRVASGPGRHLRVRARCVVLAGGGMTCAQLLLLSDRARPEGLGNRHDLVGRYYMDHPIMLGGRFVPSSRRLFEEMTFYDLRSVRGEPVMGYLQIADAALRRERLLPLSMLLFPRRDGDRASRALTARQEDGVDAARRARAALKRRERPAMADLGQALRGLDGLAVRVLNARASASDSHIGRGGWSKGLSAAHDFATFEIFHGVEQPPRWDNRIHLSESRDALGCRRVSVDWRWHEEDMANAMRAQDLFASALERAGLGRVEILRPDGRPQMRSLSASHYMGMTRMHADPREGVVDDQCEVHGVENLFIASSSVFATGGLVNPTLTIAAFALRIADRIKRRLAETPLVVAPARRLRPSRLSRVANVVADLLH